MSQIEPFDLKDFARGFNMRYPSLSELKEFHQKTKYPDEFGLYRAWLTEGIPYVFSDIPLLFEKIRDFIGNEIGVHPSDIKLVGSARTGYSLDPSKNGKAFSNNSDLDLAVVSHHYFLECEMEFLKFKKDYEEKSITPANSRQTELWPEIISDIDRQRRTSGFIDIFKIPTLQGYPVAKNSINTCWRVTERLKLTPFGPKVKKCSIRVYRNTESFMKQNNINFRCCLA